MKLPIITLRKAWHWYLITVGLASVGYIASPYLHTGLYFSFLSFLPVIAILIGMKYAAGEFRRPWAMFAVGQTLFAIGDLIAYTNPTYHFPGVEDMLYLGMYPFTLGAAVMLLDRHRDVQFRQSSRLDEYFVMIGTGFATLAGIVAVALFALPDVDEGLLSTAYPALDLAFLGLLYTLRPGSENRHLLARENRSRTFNLLFAGAIALFVTDMIYALAQLTFEYAPGGDLDFGWLLYYLGLGTVAMTDEADRPFRDMLSPKLTLKEDD